MKESTADLLHMLCVITDEEQCQSIMDEIIKRENNCETQKNVVINYLCDQAKEGLTICESKNPINDKVKQIFDNMLEIDKPDTSLNLHNYKLLKETRKLCLVPDIGEFSIDLITFDSILESYKQ